VTPAAAFRELLVTFDRLSIRYLVTGSIASSFYGSPRATRDIDLIAEVRLEHVGPLVSALGHDFYVDADMMQEAIAAKRAFNAIHFATSYKFDIFPAGTAHILALNSSAASPPVSRSKMNPSIFKWSARKTPSSASCFGTSQGAVFRSSNGETFLAC
jgi:hypothetical protein